MLKKKSGTYKNKGHKDAAAFMKEKPVRRILEYYYFPEGQVSARDIRSSVGEEFEEKADLWPELNLAAVDMDADTLVFQDARDCFVDPLDLAWLKEHGVVSMYSLSFEQSDLPAARRLMANVMASCKGRICSDTDDFEPSWGLEDLKS